MLDLADRLTSLLDHLGLARAHFATQMPGDLVRLAEGAGGRIAGLVLAVPSRLDPAPFTGMASRILIVNGDSGAIVQATSRAAARLAGAQLRSLQDYAATAWSDVARERGCELAAAMIAHLAAIQGDHAAAQPSGEIPAQGMHAGISWRAQGAGPALILLPFFLAPSQWDPILDRLARHFTVIRIGGAHVGGIAILEGRASRPSYQAMFRTLLDQLAPPGNARILDVGCGSGALARAAARRYGDARIDAIDLNSFMLSQARDLAAGEALAQRIAFTHGSAEDIPFPADTFDAVYSVTVIEECDADRAIAEMQRVVKPGGRVGIVVRAIDMPQMWNFDVPPAIAARAGEPPQSVAATGIADRSLYARMLGGGLVDLVALPTLVTLDNPGSNIWRYREDYMVAQLSSAELADWMQARNAAAEGGWLFHAHGMHCAVARKPA